MDTSSPSCEMTAEGEGAVVHTAMGWVCVVSRMGRLVASCLPLPTRKAAIAAWGAAADFGRRSALLDEASCDLRRYFSGETVSFSEYPLDLSRQAPFHRRALLAARRIPRGEVRTYAWVAARAGSPRAARAVGQAMSRNTIPLIIPCHRVIASDGGLGGFGGGLELKRALLLLEGAPRSVTSPPI